VQNRLNQKIGILGGGQLGKMLCQAGSKLGLDITILEKDHSFPAFQVCSSYVCGDITSYDDVMRFGENMDIITIEIENVNVDALADLEKAGKKVYPPTDALRVIKDKGKQKMFYEGNGFPTSDFELLHGKDELIQLVMNQKLDYPFVQKSRTDGYDGKGVHIVRKNEDLETLLEGPCLVETMVDISKEIAVIVARNPSGEMMTFPSVEMHFHPTANLVEFLFCPSSLTPDEESKAKELAKNLAQKLNVVGLLAVEMFVDKNGEILINEVAPRPHNSGHHTIEACVTSQYEMHLRAILDLPLGSTALIRPAVMVNLLGEEGFTGDTFYEGIEDCLKLGGVYPHLYGKKETKPFRKMGHVTIVEKSLDDAIVKAKFVQNHLKVISSNGA
jgi:5-(carboxyamino)imidazole ribonucleotide synthase